MSIEGYDVSKPDKWTVWEHRAYIFVCLAFVILVLT